MDDPQSEDTADGDNGAESQSRLPLSADEQRVIQLYDQLQQLRLEIAIIKAQALPSPSSGMATDIQIYPSCQHTHTVATAARGSDEVSAEAQQDLLDSRARFRLRQDVIEAVMTANPILKAVHGGTDASPVERHVSGLPGGLEAVSPWLTQTRDLLPRVQERDEAALTVAKQASDMGMLRNELIKIQAETAQVARHNVGLTSALLDLVTQLKQKQAGHPDDVTTEGEMARLRGEVKASRQRWRVVKGVASGMVAGSGVDWARDDELRDIVLEPEDEDW
ncbi:hypothetical protein DCS_03886 [Drechmeria coniospora]|uniref:Centromere protein H C-terminal domain-containing protein n=1 Tax=Drechmeria coniospora TaxID=98403 RepID=A0A151GIF2_DRECN|nr:hypothetical protein DCS_03886 [Drechmeria coniospora]KYK56880.1 hypothetical protein DCS_03886 [Drechmeria coniospora]